MHSSWPVATKLPQLKSMVMVHIHPWTLMERSTRHFIKTLRLFVKLRTITHRVVPVDTQDSTISARCNKSTPTWSCDAYICKHLKLFERKGSNRLLAFPRTIHMPPKQAQKHLTTAQYGRGSLPIYPRQPSHSSSLPFRHIPSPY